MNWSPEQSKALDAVAAWYDTGPEGPQVFRLDGYAGTGKTTLAKHFAQAIENVIFATFTGKAAHVLASKGCHGARTIHSLIYQPRERGSTRYDDLTTRLAALIEKLRKEMPSTPIDKIDAWIEANENVRELRRLIKVEEKMGHKPLFQLKETSDLTKAGLLVVDEVSMVGPEMAHDLMSFGVKMLVMGDPAQLPPIEGEGFFHKGKPDILLTEIHRQAQDNPIIRLATMVRNGQALQVGDYGESRILHRSQATKDMYLSHDQIIVGRNATRRGCNSEYRRLSGRGESPFPVTGDKLVCLRNNSKLGLLNGSLWSTKTGAEAAANRLSLHIEPLDGVGSQMTLCAHKQYFLGETPPFYEVREAECFDFGNALTCHKSQGSQFDSVLILDESAAFKQYQDQWLYTAITRAAKRFTMIKM